MRVFRVLLGLGIVLLRMTTTVAGAAGAAALIACIVIARSGITGWRAAALLVFGPGVAALLNRFGAAFTALRAATLRLFSLLTWCLGFLSWLLAAVIALQFSKPRIKRPSTLGCSAVAAGAGVAAAALAGVSSVVAMPVLGRCARS